MVPVGDSTDESQAKTDAAVSASTHPLRPVERFEYPFSFVLGDAGPSIRHNDERPATVTGLCRCLDGCV